MKIGCTAWAFSYPHYEAPYEEAIETVGRLGFDGVELIIFTKKDLDGYYTASKVKELRKLYESYHLELSQFAVYTPAVQGLVSLDPLEKEAALEDFRKSVQIGRELGAQVMNLVSHWINGLKAPIAYPPTYVNPFAKGVDRVEPKLKMELPEPFDWNRLWTNYVDSLRQCLAMIEEAGMQFAIEGHANVVVSNTDSMLRLFDHLPSDNIGVNFDTAWHLIQREYISMSVKKLKDKVFHVHVRDGDGMYNYHLPPGQGVIDWDDFIEALKSIDYKGYLSLEMGRYADPHKYIKQAKEYLEARLLQAGVR